MTPHRVADLLEIATHSPSPKFPQWYRPTVSPEHGVYVMLMVSFLTGAAAAQQWSWGTTLALVCAFCGFQAEHPLVWQIKQRKTRKPRLLLWASLYGGIARAIAQWLVWHNSALFSLLLIYSLAIRRSLPLRDRSFNLRSSFSLASSTKIPT